IHLSVIIGQVEQLLEIVIPELIIENIPFQFVQDKLTAKSILNGFIGISELGKIIKIYFSDQESARKTAIRLVHLTPQFYGPAIPGDAQLSESIYVPAKQATLYGSLVKTPEKSGKIIQGKYYPKEVIKADIKGSVIRAFYIKGFLNIGSCIIKQGHKAMWADEHGQDIGHRLRSQHQIHQDLKGTIHIPEIIDLFTHNGDTYLAMEYIKGVSLETKISTIYQGRHWQHLEQKAQQHIINYLLRILEIIEKLHEKGYIHRDLTPVNFMINKKDEIYLIDMEMAYSIAAKHPAFNGGTEGFMSKEQHEEEAPIFEDDIYGFGALMIASFTNMPPLKLDRQHAQQLSKSLTYFVGNERLAQVISTCFDQPAQRPSLKQLASELAKFRMTLADVKDRKASATPARNTQSLHQVIASAINGLSVEQFSTIGQVFGATKQAEHGVSNVKYIRFAASGVLCPITGILALLSRPFLKGDQVQDLREFVTPLMPYFESSFLNRYHPEQPGLLNGNAGLALTLGYAIKAKLLPASHSYRDYLVQCFSTDATTFDMAEGIAGQGLAWILLKDYIPTELFQQKLQHYTTLLLRQQQKQGSWTIDSTPEEKHLTLGLAMGQAGIVLFLLECYQLFPNQSLKQSIEIGINSIQQEIGRVKKDDTLFYGKTGIALLYIQAYKYCKKEAYKQAAEKVLASLPSLQIRPDYSFALGLSGLGITYVEAAKVLGDERWKREAEWIAGLCLATFHQAEEDKGYWNVDGVDNYDSGFLTGTTGVIYFLMQYADLISKDSL
ncbi:lanthionine synthetase LanC family protein, partial [Pedobacter sp.]|uniref:lanthionine synthetase LanC family protein n=1 Tax=Pedobacter sp. TaxID=1411316 RepID=UPI002BD7827B